VLESARRGDSDLRGVGLQDAAIPARQRVSTHSGLEADQRRD